MVDEPVGGGVLVRREAAATGLLVVDLLLEQHRRLAEQLAQHVDDEAAADEVVEHRIVVDEVLAARQHGAGVGLFEVVQPGTAVDGPAFQSPHGSVEFVETVAVQRLAHDEPAVAPECVDVERVEPGGHVGAPSSWRSRAIIGAQSRTDGWVRSICRATGPTRGSPPETMAIWVRQRGLPCWPWIGIGGDPNARPGSVHAIQTSGVSALADSTPSTDRISSNSRSSSIAPSDRWTSAAVPSSATSMPSMSAECVGEFDRGEVGDRLLVVVRHGQHHRVIPPVAEVGDHLAVRGVGGPVLLDRLGRVRPVEVRGRVGLVEVDHGEVDVEIDAAQHRQHRGIGRVAERAALGALGEATVGGPHRVGPRAAHLSDQLLVAGNDRRPPAGGADALEQRRRPWPRLRRGHPAVALQVWLPCTPGHDGIDAGHERGVVGVGDRHRQRQRTHRRPPAAGGLAPQVRCRRRADVAVRHRVDHDHHDAEPPGELCHVASVRARISRRVSRVSSVGRAVAATAMSGDWRRGRSNGDHGVMNHADRQDRERWIASGLPDAVVTIMFRDGTLAPPHAARWYDSSLTTDEITEFRRSGRPAPDVAFAASLEARACPPTLRSSRRGQGSTPPRSSARSIVASSLANSSRPGPTPTPTSPRPPNSQGCCRATSSRSKALGHLRAGRTPAEIAYADEAGIKVKKALDWIERGMSAQAAASWSSAGFSASSAAAWAEVVADPEVARLLESVGFDVDSAREQRPDEGWTTHVVRRRVALDAGATEETADDWAATPLPDRKLAKWVASGVRPSDAAGWLERDVRPTEAARWSAAGFSPADADAWRASGVDPDIAARRRDAGVRPATPD